MINTHAYYAANLEDVAAEVIDGELIIIRLSDGTYYSMDNVGAHVWELLASGHSLPLLVRTIAEWYATPAERVEGDVSTLVRELLSERLIVPAADGAGSVSADATQPAGPLSYETPRLNIYRDMGNLLALDPPTPGIDELLFRDGKAG
jgi:coenzyme PQQ synthesis protein D (PqqD)